MHASGTAFLTGTAASFAVLLLILRPEVASKVASQRLAGIRKLARSSVLGADGAELEKDASQRTRAEKSVGQDRSKRMLSGRRDLQNPSFGGLPFRPRLTSAGRLELLY